MNVSTPADREGDLSPTSPNEDSDSGFLSPPPDPEPEPGLHGVPVRCEQCICSR